MWRLAGRFPSDRVWNPCPEAEDLGPIEPDSGCPACPRCPAGEDQKARRLRRREEGVTRHPQVGSCRDTGGAGAFTCVNLFSGNDLDFPRVPTVFIRKRKNRCGRPLRKHIDSTGSAVYVADRCRRSKASGRSMVSRPQKQRQQQHQRAISHFSAADCTERERPVKALRCAPTAGAARKKRGLD
jgi:hypothetical protein